jgi:Ser/Thr protein kinase RdoA (MazF antagonist)
MNNKPDDFIFNYYSHLGEINNITNINNGLINKTWLIETKYKKYILQKVSAIFDTTIHDDAWAVSNHLSAYGLKVPFIIRDNNNNLYINYKNEIYRALEFIEGHSYNKINNNIMAYQAGTMLGLFHKYLMDFNYEYKSKRRQDFAFHAHNLSENLKIYHSHEYYIKVKNIAQHMLSKIHSISADFKATPRHIHGDPKISNILFDNNSCAIALIDFDTLNKSGWSLELGDALRSWANPCEEDDLFSHVDLDIAAQALKGYGEIMKSSWSKQERAELLITMRGITLNLAIRYLSDVLSENYFAYDPTRYKRACDHNWQRAQAMYALYEEFERKKYELREIINNFL